MPSRERRPGALTIPMIIGVLAGLSLSHPWGAGAMAIGAAVGGLLLAATEITARARQRPHEIPALYSRIAPSVALAAIFGALLGLTGAGPLVVGLVFGLIAGVLGIRPQKLVLGPIVGLAVGWLLSTLWTDAECGRTTTRPGKRTDEPARGAAGGAQPHRRGDPARRHGLVPGLDPVVPRHR